MSSYFRSSVPSPSARCGRLLPDPDK